MDLHPKELDPEDAEGTEVTERRADAREPTPATARSEIVAETYDPE
jgi:hypothetical protein